MDLASLSVSYFSLSYWAGVAVIALCVVTPLARTAARRKLTTRRN